MTELAVVGGVYYERCEWPEWNMIFGSGGRAATAVTSLIDKVRLWSYASDDAAPQFSTTATLYGFEFSSTKIPRTLSFDYIHPLSIPTLRPPFGTIPQGAPILVNGETVLRFGMLEGTAVVRAKTCVYDPQSAFAPEHFHANGSVAERLAIVANSDEVRSLSGIADPLVAAQELLLRSKAEVVVVKSGLEGALVMTSGRYEVIPAYQTKSSFTIGSGDVFAAAFAAFWGVHGCDPIAASRLSSLAVADYVEDRSLPIRPADALASNGRKALKPSRDRIYLAGPFFTMAQRWLIDEARRCLTEAGLKVFSPFHEIGPGPAEEIAPADIAAIVECQSMFAILDGLDSGTVYEVGYARALGKPVVGFSQIVSEEDLKMIEGSGCMIFSDFATAILAAAARP
ncbi:putative nucleoside 2-deoxyribosyltransferase [Bradyrhizobium sp. ORS 285]|uniref:PfkB family carbohydrate kinase n=1 Tax=Bradyrhizobium sp. ORS 285 TaxID=115808 RepID=UPI00024094C4|nr:PfkB family carbohydrate kinase [Bradyrhizobium sp. ORS 285]CCD86331.1 putative nucleoside 2-deoxyribosyltransferase [Bradyrhizobium sp. ORS 285]SMX56135.1 putative nucleoside 2-deoxyribosyltransferase [Bradyrhizobium sp. ORS 285]